MAIKSTVTCAHGQKVGVGSGRQERKATHTWEVFIPLTSNLLNFVTELTHVSGAIKGQPTLEATCMSWMNSIGSNEQVASTLEEAWGVATMIF